MYLKDIIDYKKQEIKEFKLNHSFKEFESKVRTAKTHFFRDNLKIKNQINIIAEIKKASPSMGIIDPVFDYLEIAKNYYEAGADAISILTDKKFFQGDITFLQKVREKYDIPVLRKDFIIDEIQILEAKASGADAVLLIKAALNEKRLKELLEFSKQYSLDVLVEVHTKDEVMQVLDAGATIIGVNNRNLHTFEVDLRNSAELFPLIPEKLVRVSESGIKNKEDILFLKQFGVDAFLIGTSFMQSTNKKDLFKELKL